MKYLVDANVISDPTKPEPGPAAVNCLRKNEREAVEINMYESESFYPPVCVARKTP